VCQENIVPVVALALFDEQGRVLVQQRSQHKHQGGLWEFPGGKVEAGESAQAALRREIIEELGVDITMAADKPRRLIRLRHDYPDKTVDLDVWLVTDGGLAAAVRAREAQPLCWLKPDHLLELPMPAADRPVVNALRLPHYYWITPALAASAVSIHKNSPQAISQWLAAVRQRLDTGVPMIQFRSATVPKASRAGVLKVLRGWCRERRVPLVYNGDLGEARAMLEYGIIDGVHLNSRQLMDLSERPVSPSVWLSASTHNADELHQAKVVGVDFASVSPVKPTTSHPESPPLGWTGFARLAAEVSMPVYALGGMSLADVPQAQRWGGQGVAGITLPLASHHRADADMPQEEQGQF